jgi:hypothetical protein
MFWRISTAFFASSCMTSSRCATARRSLAQRSFLIVIHPVPARAAAVFMSLLRRRLICSPRCEQNLIIRALQVLTGRSKSSVGCGGNFRGRHLPPPSPNGLKLRRQCFLSYAAVSHRTEAKTDSRTELVEPPTGRRSAWTVFGVAARRQNGPPAQNPRQLLRSQRSISWRWFSIGSS